MKRDLELEACLKQYTPPDINPDIRTYHIEQLSEDIREMDYLPRQSFAGQILTHLSYISGWIWLVQAAMLCLIFFYVFQANLLLVNMLLFCFAPGLSLILIYELSKSFRAGIWEMEASCRYNLAQIFLFRLCILFGGDFMVLTGALAAYRMIEGALWEFCFYALLPFFLTSAVSLYLLRRIGSRWNSAVMAGVSVMAGILEFGIMSFSSQWVSLSTVSLTKVLPLLTLLALVPLIYNALKLCTEIHYLNENRKDRNLWNFE